MVLCSVRLHLGILYSLTAGMSSYEHSTVILKPLILYEQLGFNTIPFLELKWKLIRSRHAHVFIYFPQLDLLVFWICLCAYEFVCTVERPIKLCDQVHVSAGCRRQARRRSALCPHCRGWMVCLGSACVHSVKQPAFIFIHHHHRDDLAFREGACLSAMLMRFQGCSVAHKLF